MSLLTPMLRSSPLTDWFSDAQRVQGMLDFEAALAQAQAACGMVPPEAVGPIVAACRHEAIDFAALGEAAVGAGNLAIPLVKQLTAKVKAQDPEAARYVHWGATSQTPSTPDWCSSCAGRWMPLRLCLSSCWRPGSPCGSLSRYRDAGPDLDAARAAGDLWPEAGGHPRRAPALAAAAARDASAAAGAAVWRRRGHSGRAKEKGPAVGLALAQILGLSLPDTPWHSQRDRLLEAGAWFAGVCGTLGKFANDFSR